uniref:Secreted protein n=1 Tax=Heterorhabditis bacteriophora TaxID=37862 RepID=A0A1I7XVE3_HETBA
MGAIGWLLLLASLFVLQIDFSLATTKKNDLIGRLPGLTFDIKFKQYSGYLDGSPGNHLHYW